MVETKHWTRPGVRITRLHDTRHTRHLHTAQSGDDKRLPSVPKVGNVGHRLVDSTGREFYPSEPSICTVGGQKAFAVTN